MPLKDLENQIGALRILIHLLKENRSYIYKIKQELDIISDTIYTALKRLKSQGLIYDEPETGFGRPRRWIYLTDKGKKVAEELVKIEKILKEK